MLCESSISARGGHTVKEPRLSASVMPQRAECKSVHEKICRTMTKYGTE